MNIPHFIMQKSLSKIVVQKGRRPNADESWRRGEGGLAKCWQLLTRGGGGVAKCWPLLTEGGLGTPDLTDVICEQPLRWCHFISRNNDQWPLEETWYSDYEVNTLPWSWTLSCFLLIKYFSFRSYLVLLWSSPIDFWFMENSLLSPQPSRTIHDKFSRFSGTLLAVNDFAHTRYVHFCPILHIPIELLYFEPTDTLTVGIFPWSWARNLG